MRQDTREQIFEFLQDYQRQNGFAPTVREICAGVGLRSPSTVHYHLNALRQAGRIGGQTERARAITLPTARSGQVPVVGTVTAGQPILAVEQIEGYLPWEGEPECFALHVRGDSMVGAAILDGDLVLVHPQPQADSGKIVVALLDDEATVKRLSRQNGQIWLLPENPNYAPIDGRNAVILGVVRAVIRQYK